MGYFKWVAVMGLLLAGVLVCWLHILYGYWDHDAGYFLAATTWIAQGYVPYVDYVWGYTPLMPILHVPLILVGIPRTAILVGSPLVWSLSIVAASFLLALSLSKDRIFALLIAALYFFFQLGNQGNHVTLEYGVIFFVLLALWLANEATSLKHFFLAGVFLALATLCKQIAPMYFLALFGLCAKKPGFLTKRTQLTLALGFLVPFVVCFGWILLRPNAVAAIVRSVEEFIGYGQQSSRGFSIKILLTEPLRAPVSTLLLGIAAFLGALDLRRSASTPEKCLSGAALLTLGLAFFPRFLNDFPHYTLTCWPAMVLLLTRPIPFRLGRFYLPRRVAYAIGIALVGSSLIGVAICNPITGCRIADKLPGKAKRIFAREETGEIYGFLVPLAEKIRELAPKGSTLLVIRGENILGFLSEMPPQDMPSENWHTPIERIPDKGSLTVLLDEANNPAFDRKRNDLKNAGYQLVYQTETPRKVEIWRPTMAPMSQQ